MSKFKVGDRVRDLALANNGIGTITRAYNNGENFVEFDSQQGAYDHKPGIRDGHYRSNDQLELAIPEQAPEFDVRAPDARPVEEALRETVTAVNPGHYSFPNGIEVIGISQWLTANAAQALQYIARSSRIDGKNKGDAMEDIEKAIRFLTFEKARLAGERK